MVKRGKRMPKREITFLKQKEEIESRRTKRYFFILFDLVILISFILALYFTYFQDYTRTIIFLVIGSLLLLYFIVREFIRKKRR